MAPLAGLIRSTSAPPMEELRIWNVCIPEVTCRQPVPHAPADTVMTLPASDWVPQPDSPAASTAATSTGATRTTGGPSTGATRTTSGTRTTGGTRTTSGTRTGTTRAVAGNSRPSIRGANGRGRAGRTTAGN